MASVTTRFPVTHVEVDGRNYASGLVWRPVSGGRSARKEAAAIGRKNGYDRAIVRQHRSMGQAGFVPTGKTLPKRCNSLAAALAGALGESWIGVFRVGDDQYVMAAAHNGAVMAGSDVTGTKEPVEQYFKELTNLVRSANEEWGRVIAPAEFGAGEEVGLSELLALSSKADHRIRALTFKVSKMQLLAGVVVLGVLAGGGWFLKTHLEKREETERLERIERYKQAQEHQAKVEQEKLVAAGPWSNQPQASEMLLTCAKGWRQIDLSVAGWVFDNGRCEPGQLTAVYRRLGAATVKNFIEQVKPRFGPPSIQQNGEVAAIAYKAEMVPASEPELPNINGQLETFASHFQAASSDIKIEDRKNAGQATDADSKDEIAPWYSHDFTLTSDVPPEAAFNGLQMLGLRVASIDVVLTHETSSLQWTVKGTLYGK